MTANLIYAANASLDGFVEDAEGKIDWTAPSPEVHRLFNELVRGVGTHLYGRRMYETMMGWETDPTYAAQSAEAQDFAAMWQAQEKVVFSTTLRAVSTLRTRLERSFSAAAVRELKARADRDLLIGGAELASHAFAAGLVDQCHVVLVPVILGGGKPALPRNVRLELVAERRFANGAVHVHYRVK